MNDQRGNVLFFVLAAIFLVGILAKVVSDRNLDVTAYSQRADLQAAAQDIRLYAAQVRQAANSIIQNNGHSASELNGVAPGALLYDTAPHSAKIFHPYGGGAPHHYNYAGWNNIILHTQASLTGVSTSDAEVMLTGRVSAGLCRLLAVNGTPATVTDGTANALLDGSSIVMADGATCTAGQCDGFKSHCVKNTSGDTWVFYTTLVPQ